MSNNARKEDGGVGEIKLHLDFAGGWALGSSHTGKDFQKLPECARRQDSTFPDAGSSNLEGRHSH